MQPAAGRDGPIWLRLPLVSHGAAHLAAVGAVARLLARDVAAGGGTVHTTLMQGALVQMTMHWHRAEHPNEAWQGLPTEQVQQVVRCADGVYLHLMISPLALPLYQRALATLSAEERAVPPAPWYMHYLPDFELYPAVFSRFTSAQWLVELWAHGVAAEPAVPLGRLYADEQALANGYVVSVDDPVFGRSLPA